jgi:tubby-related protein 1
MMVTALPRSASVDGQAPQINIPLALPVITDMRRFLSQPVPKQCGMIQGYIKRSSGGGVFYPRYTVFMKEGDRFLMSSKKRNYNKTSNYPISMDEKDLNPYGPNYLGKLRSNFLGTEYTIFDDGVSNGKDDKDGDEEKNRESMSSSSARTRCELGAVTYASTFVTAAPRKMQVAIPGVHEKDQKALVWKDNSGPLGESDSLVSRIKSRQFSREEVSCYINKPPRWNESIGGYVLNFGGRVTMASVKNFQLVDPDDQTKIVMQFGKVGKDDFTLDFQFPMSPLQAFAIALSSFDSKIACD